MPEPSRKAVETVAGQIGAAIDRTRAEEALRESEARLLQAQAIARLGNWEVDLASQELLASAGALQIYGIEGFGGKPACLPLSRIQQLAHPEDRPALDEAIRALLNDGRPYDQEFRLLRQNDGVLRIVHARAEVIRSAAGQPLRVVGVIQDITENKLLEAQLFETQKIEAVGALAGGIAHDFNNILGAIIGFAEMAGEETDEAARQGYIAKVLKAAERAKNLTGQILSFSRRSLHDKQPVDLRPVVREAVQLLRQTIPATIEIRLNLPPSPCTVNADATQMHQILMNLCTNAAQAMGEEGGILRVGLARSEIRAGGAAPERTALKPGAYVRLTVSDSGPGIDPAVADRIFEPFFTTKEAGKGTGLGLSVAYGIARNHGGGITVANPPGEGATFSVHLPASEGVETVPAGPAAGKLPRGSERILFVDDEPAMIELGRRMLCALGYDVTTCRDSGEALEAFLQDPDRFDLVITDMTMPRMTGRDLARRILAAKPRLPVILCTGYNEHISEAQALQMGIRAFLPKPFTRREMAQVVRAVLDAGDGNPAPPLPAR
jgi:PAS domain S-box-containing protein